MEETKLPYRNSRLFSGHFLAERLPHLPDWEITSQELESVYAQLRDLFAAAVPSTSESALEEELIRPILSDILGFSYLVQPSRQIFKTHRKPDYALFPDEEMKQAAKASDGKRELFEYALAVADAKAWGVDLDTVGPASQMHDYILLSGVCWGVITNGRRWRLYHRDTVHELDTFYEVDLESLVAAEDHDPLKYFLLFFRADSFEVGAFLDRTLTQRVEAAHRIGTELKENVFEALRLLCQGFFDGNESLDTDDILEIHENGLILLYRILFLLYAESEEERELLPLSNQTYREQVSLYALKHEVASRDNWIEESHTLWSRLRDLFGFVNRGNPRLGIYEYNGGLFSPVRYPFLEQHQLGDRYLADALRLLACKEEDGQIGFFDYATLDVRELGSIYEGLLDHALVLKSGTLAWQKDSAERKKTGSYYTPEYIVSYIVENTVGPLVDEVEDGMRVELSALEKRISHARGEERKLLQREKEKLLRSARERVLNLKILDPAMGSGHFSVSACDYLARRIAELEAALTKKETEEAVPDLKRAVAVRSLYGVDLNPMATELAKLSLWLHTVAKGKPLSFLDHHLRTGNSLIGATVNELKRPPSGKPFEIGLWESRLVEDLGKAIRHLAFIKESASDSRSDIEAKNGQWALVNEWIGKYKQAADAWLSPYFGGKLSDGDYAQVIEAAADNKIARVVDKPFFMRVQRIIQEKHIFHWELEFPDVFFDRFGRPLDNPGFDAVIGNPPYVRQEQLSENKRYFKAAYATYAGTADLYVYFYEKSHLLLRREGRFGMITSNKFIRAAYGEALREYLAENAHIVELIDFGDLPVFPGVSAYPCIVLTVKAGGSAPTRYLRVPSLEFESLSQLVTTAAAELPPEAISGADWRLMSAAEYAILKKMEHASVPLKAWLKDGKISYGIKTGLNKAFSIDEVTRARLIAEDPKSAELIKPLVVGENIKRYEIEYKGRYLIFTRRGVDIDRYPAIKRHLEQFKNELRPKPAHWNPTTQGPWLGRKPGSYKWYEIQDSIDYYADFEKPKIMYQEIAKSQAFAYDQQCLFGNNKVFITPTKDLYLLGVLNSPVAWRYFTSHVSKLHGDTFALQSIYVEKFPIRRIAFVTPKEERAELVDEGKRLYFEALDKLELEGSE
ncbi:Eco57I restriction-modification methylase domain-containing protein [Candidatus Bipolaricaulota bacterium]|nr:Eco57I restriction-modification methylase domain-containing protein [Candidatus Bipolaricaulota bacterium]